MHSIVVNSRLLNLKQSATVLINQKVRDLRAKGEKVHHFGFGQSPFPIHPRIQESLRQAAHEKSYLPTLGLPELRKAISNFIKKFFGSDFDEEHIIIGPGSKQLLYQATAIIEGPILLPTPSWVSYGPQAEMLGKRMIWIKTSKENAYKLTAEELDCVCEDLEHRQKILLMNTPHNPSGSVYTENEIHDIAEVCRKYNVVILSDEIYAYIDFTTEKPNTFARHFPEGTIVTGGLSKAFSAGGYRLGFLAAPNDKADLIDCMGVMTSQTYTSVSSPIQYAGLEAYSNPEVWEYARDCTKIHRLTSSYLFKRFTEMGMGCVEPKGAFYLFPDLQNYQAKLRELKLHSAGKLTRELLDKYRVAVLPGSAFNYPTEYLAFRASTTDYDGAAAYEAMKRGEELNFDFVEKYCPSLKEGADALESFMKTLDS